MSQKFEYPNLIAGTGDIATVNIYVSDGGPVSETVGTDAAVGRYKHIVFPSDVHLWAIITAQMSDAFRDVHEGTRLSISAFLRVSDGSDNMSLDLMRGDGTENAAGGYNQSRLDVRGWRYHAATCVRNNTGFNDQAFYVGIGPRKAGFAIDIAQPMVCIADEPHAWAPAEGEVWP